MLLIFMLLKILCIFRLSAIIWYSLNPICKFNHQDEKKIFISLLIKIADIFYQWNKIFILGLIKL
jgi:hypothetical protein